MRQITFAELSQYNDNNAIIMTGLLLEDNEVQDVNTFFHECGLISEDKEVIGAAHLSDNVLGSDGRSDIVILLSDTGTINPMVRLQLRMGGMNVMWVSDFMDNYSQDYRTAC